MKEYIQTYGNSTISKNDLEHRDLFYWAGNLRRYYYKGTLAKDKIRRLNEIGFEWKGENRREIYDLDDIWWSSYEKLIDYYKQNGDSDVPARYKNDKPLGTWVVSQRASKRKNKLAQSRIDLLDELDFSWDPKVKIFDQFCERLLEFKAKYGHTEVPILGAEFPKLGRWTNKYRVILNNGILNSNGSVTHGGSTLTKKQIEKLNELGFKKAVRKVKWEDYYDELKEYYIKTGHSRPSQSDSSNLYYWCYKTRKHQDQLTTDQRKQLEDLEFDFNFEFKYSRSGSNQNWNERFSELQLFYEENQHFDLTPENEVFEGLYKWLVYQRRQFKKGILTTERIAILRSIGFNFDIHFQPRSDTDWEGRYKQLKEFYLTNKTFFISTNDKDNKGLLSWLRYQRKLYRDEKLEEEKKIKLLELGYSFNKTYRGEKGKSNVKHEAIWIEKFEQLKSYHSKYNTFYIQRSDEEYKHLIPWLQYQKSLYRNDKLQVEKISKLSSIGFSFDIDYRGKKFQFEIKPGVTNQQQFITIDKQWQYNFERLKEYYSEFRTFLIPSTESKLQPLRSWLQYQKQLYKKGKLDKVKTQKLEAIGFSFTLDYRGRKPKNDTFADDAWLRILEELISYHAEYKTFLIPKHLTQYNHLKVWLQEQKRLYNAGRLSEHKLDLLSQIGYSFELNYRGKKFEYETNPALKENKPTKEPKSDSWERNYLKLIDYKIQKGNCNVPRSHEDKSLANFVSRQRYSFRRNTLLKTQIQKLEILGFEWEVKRSPKSDAWSNKFSLLKNFYETNGHSGYKKSNGDVSLYNWVLFQRMEKRKGKLTDERIKALNSINVCPSECRT
jgi:hypothetical protein